MADWRQIQARIRKAKAGADAAAELSELYEHTRDAMVAFELARWQEKAGEHAEAARWYTAAAERFRRSQWKSKAEAALARLRAPTPAAAEPLEQSDASKGASEGASSALASEAWPAARDAEFQSRAISPDSTQAQDASIARFESAPEAGDESHQTSVRGANKQVAGREAQDEPVRKGPRRRGRRGGRNRRRTAEGSPSRTTVASSDLQAGNSHFQPPSDRPERGSTLKAQTVSDVNAPVDASDVAPPIASSRARSRAGEPALASRMVHLESQLRRLLACPQAKLDQAESAPAGPGVLLLSDSDQVTHYYVESCQTLRIAIGNLVRGGRGAKDAPRLKERLAENLGIAESRVTNYLKEHCAVRWLQLDEGASELAHFAIAVLRPAVNE
jgi:hypothetical protein